MPRGMRSWRGGRVGRAAARRSMLPDAVKKRSPGGTAAVWGSLLTWGRGRAAGQNPNTPRRLRAWRLDLAQRPTEAAVASDLIWSHFLRKTGDHFSGKCSGTSEVA